MNFIKKFVENSTSGVDKLRAEVKRDAKESGRKVPKHEIEREVVARMSGRTKSF